MTKPTKRVTKRIGDREMLDWLTRHYAPFFIDGEEKGDAPIDFAFVGYENAKGYPLKVRAAIRAAMLAERGKKS